MPALLIAILLLAACLRLTGLAFGLPNSSRPDEEIHVVQSLTILRSCFIGKPDFNPHMFLYPSLFTYVLTGAYYVYFLYGSAMGKFVSMQAFVNSYINDPTALHAIGRFVSAMFGTATVAAVYKLGGAFSRSKTVALLASLSLAVCFLHVRDSHFATTDVALTLWITLCLWQAIVSYQTKSKKNILLAALFCGLATATKYPGVLCIVPCLLACSNIADRKQELILMGKVFAVFLFVFFIASPFVILDYARVIYDLRYQFSYAIGQVPLGYIKHLQHIPGWWYHLRFSLWSGFGVVGMVLSASGLVIALKREKQSGVFGTAVLLGFLIAYVLLIGALPSAFVRYMVPVLPVLSVYAAFAIVQLANWRRLTANGKIPSWAILSFLTIVACVQPLVSSVRFDQICLHDDTRVLARQWLIDHAKAGDAIGVGQPFGSVQLPANYKSYVLIPKDSVFAIFQNAKPDAGVYVTNHPVFNSCFAISTYTDNSMMNKLGIRYIVLSRSPLWRFSTPDNELNYAASHYLPVARFLPYAKRSLPPNSDDFDQLDCFYLPFKHLARAYRPGPQIDIYALPGVRKSSI